MEKRDEPILALLADPESRLMRNIARSLQIDPVIALLGDREKGVAFPELVSTYRPDIVISDLDYHGKCDFSVIDEVKRLSGGITKVIGITDCEDRAVAAMFIHRGGWGYELKNCGLDEIALAVRRIAQGHCFVCTALVNDFFYDAVQESPPLDPEQLKTLTETEWQVLTVYKRNFDAKEIALVLNMTVGTANTHLRNIRRKLGIRGRGRLEKRLAFTVLM